MSEREWKVDNPATGKAMTGLVFIIIMCGLNIPLMLSKAAIGWKIVVGIVSMGLIVLIVRWMTATKTTLSAEAGRLTMTVGRRRLVFNLSETRCSLGIWERSQVGVMGSILHLEGKGGYLPIAGVNVLFHDPEYYKFKPSDKYYLQMGESDFRDLLTYLNCPSAGGEADRPIRPIFRMGRFNMDKVKPDDTGRSLAALRFTFDDRIMLLETLSTGGNLIKVPREELEVKPATFILGSDRNQREFSGMALVFKLPEMGETVIGAAMAPSWALPVQEVGKPAYQLGPAELLELIRILGLDKELKPTAAA